MRLRTHGQALTIVALFLPVLIACWLLAIELAWRSVTVHSVSDALRAANRSAVQTFDYAAFAHDRLALAEPDAVVAVARRLAATNLTGIKGLARSPDEIAAAADWLVLPAGGQCTLEASRPPLRFLTPALCSRADIDLISPLGFSWRMRVYAADTLDRSSAIAGSRAALKGKGGVYADLVSPGSAHPAARYRLAAAGCHAAGDRGALRRHRRLVAGDRGGAN